jgi:hypothetical protein
VNRGRIQSKLGSLSIFSKVSPGGLGVFSGPNTWYMKNIHSPIAARASTRIGRAIAIVAMCVGKCFQQLQSSRFQDAHAYFQLSVMIGETSSDCECASGNNQ